jgi:hypothetical protein
MPMKAFSRGLLTCVKPMPGQRFHRDERTAVTSSNPRICLLAGMLGLLAITFSVGQINPAAANPDKSRPGTPRHGIAMHGEPVLAPGFDHLRYANPPAPKGGRLTHGVLGTFDSLNPFIVKGLAPSQIRGTVIERCWRVATTNRSRSMACWPRRSKLTLRAAT